MPTLCMHTGQPTGFAAHQSNVPTFAAFISDVDDFVTGLPDHTSAHRSRVAATLASHPELTRDSTGRLAFLELAVDALLKHDVRGAALLYAAHLLIATAQAEGEGRAGAEGVDSLLQSPAAPVAARDCSVSGDQRSSRLESGCEGGDATPAQGVSLCERVLRLTRGEVELLADMRGNPEIVCGCLGPDGAAGRAMAASRPASELLGEAHANVARPSGLCCATCGEATDFEGVTRRSRVACWGDGRQASQRVVDGLEELRPPESPPHRC